MSDPKIHIVTEKEFSALANQAMFTTFDVYSTRKFVNVITTIGGHYDCQGDSAGNHFYDPARDKVREYIKECVDDVRGWHGWNGDDFHLGEIYGSNGHYRVTLWRDK